VLTPIRKLCHIKWLPVPPLLGSCVLIMGCAGGTQQAETALQPEEPPPARDSGTAQQAEQIRDLREEVAELQLRLLGKDAQVAELQTNLEEAIQEVVRTKAKLQSVESRAEAASTMAEAEIALKVVREAAAEPGPEVFQAEQLLEMSAREFENENYGGSLYLASQAMSLVNIGQGRLGGDDLPRRAGELLFAIPLRMEVARTSNAREGPGLNFKILFTLPTGAQLVGLAYKDQWVRFRGGDGRSGWIFHSLVRGANR
jgi:hypothetical protein